LRHALRWGRLWPFLLGAAFGVPLGVAILGWARPDYVRVTVGAVLVLYSAYSLARPAMKPVKGGGATADADVGFLNGILGGLTGLAFPDRDGAMHDYTFSMQPNDLALKPIRARCFDF